jgi:tripartite-type tricarboxylate transporter receptor subunit TctC
MAPAKTPEAVIRKLNEGVVRAIHLPDVKAALAAQGAQPVGGSPAELAAVIAADTARWAKVIKEANIEIRQ